MREGLLELQFDAPEAAYRQVTEKVRDLITRGDLTPGTRLPSSVELSKQWGLNLRTIHDGMVPLVKEGLLERRPRRGTYVRQRDDKLTRVGMYYSENAWAQGGSPFLQALHAAVKTELAEIGVETDVWIDPRPASEMHKPWESLAQAAKQRRLQAMIVTSTDLPHIAWLSKLHIPVAYLSSAKLPNCVSLDQFSFLELGLRALRAQRCRTVGMLPAFDLHETAFDGKPAHRANVMAALPELAQSMGLSIQKQWLRRSTKNLNSPALMQQFGHEQFTALWRHPSRPDGLIVTTDAAATGVVAAVLEQGVRVPDELKLVISKNSAVDIFCPVPATFIEVNTQAIAAALVEQVHKQFRGEPVSPVAIKFRDASTSDRATQQRQE